MATKLAGESERGRVGGIFRAGNLKILLRSQRMIFLIILIQQDAKFDEIPCIHCDPTIVSRFCKSFCCCVGELQSRSCRQHRKYRGSPTLEFCYGFQGWEKGEGERREANQNFTALKTRGELQLNSCYERWCSKILLLENWMERIIANCCTASSIWRR